MKKDDDGRRLVIHLTQNGQPYHISDGCTAKFTAERPDGKRVSETCSVENCVIRYEVTTAVTSVVGVHTCEIILNGAKKGQITSSSFRIIVESPVCDDDDDTVADVPQMVELISVDEANVTETLHYNSVTGESNRKVNMKAPVGGEASEALVGPNTLLLLKADAAQFGDAEAADVAAGKTFTSASGLRRTGTHRCTGGGVISATDDGAGNVVISLSGLSATADGDGNIVIA